MIVGGDIVQTFSRMTLSVINIVFAVTIVLIIIVLVWRIHLRCIPWRGSWCDLSTHRGLCLLSLFRAQLEKDEALQPQGITGRHAT